MKMFWYIQAENIPACSWFEINLIFIHLIEDTIVTQFLLLIFTVNAMIFYQ